MRRSTPSSTCACSPRPSDADQNWLVDWPEAVRAGLAGAFPIPDGLGPQQLGGIAVVGLGDEEPETLFAHQILTGALAEVALGAATNSVGGGTTALSTQRRDGAVAFDGGPDVDAFRAAARARITGSAPDSRGLDAAVGSYLVGSDRLPAMPRPAARSVIETVESHPEDPVAATGLSRLMLRALWPSLWGSWLFDGWGIAKRGPAIHAWAFENMHPEGPLPALRFGEQPYGVLPVTALRDWTPGAEVAEPDIVRQLAWSVQQVQTGLHRRLRGVGSVRTADGGRVDRERYVELLGRGGSSRSFQYGTFEGSSALAGIDEYRDFLDRALGLVGLSLPADKSGAGRAPWPAQLARLAAPFDRLGTRGRFAPVPTALPTRHGLRRRKLVEWPHDLARQADELFASDQFPVVPEAGGVVYSRPSTPCCGSAPLHADFPCGASLPSSACLSWPMAPGSGRRFAAGTRTLIMAVTMPFTTLEPTSCRRSSTTLLVLTSAPNRPPFDHVVAKSSYWTPATRAAEPRNNGQKNPLAGKRPPGSAPGRKPISPEVTPEQDGTIAKKRHRSSTVPQ